MRALGIMAAVLSMLFVSSFALRASSISVGDSIPEGVELDFGFPPQKVDLSHRMKGKNVILLGLPGAFTPT